MPGLSASSRRVRVINANWTASGKASDDGVFELLIVTEDDERHVVTASAATATALAALIQGSDVVLVWDPEAQGLTVGNLYGHWLDHDLSLLPVNS